MTTRIGYDPNSPVPPHQDSNVYRSGRQPATGSESRHSELPLWNRCPYCGLGIDRSVLAPPSPRCLGCGASFSREEGR